ncbi:MAG: AAA family ATPase [Pirellulales bacterium]|nr:AAA family ATPase [Pirellulales bacterium]
MPHTPLSTRRQMELLHELQQLADWRATEEARIAAALRKESAAAAEEFESTAQSLHKQYSTQRRDLETQFAEAKQAVEAGLEQDRALATRELAAAIDRLDAEESDALAAAKQRAQEAQWEAMAVFDASKDKPEQHWAKASKLVAVQRQQLEGLQRDADALLGMRRLKRPEASFEEAPDESADQDPASDAAERLRALLSELREAVLAMQGQKLPTLFLEGGGPWGWLVGAVAIGAVIAAFLGESFSAAGIGAALGGLVVAGMLWGWLLPKSRRQTYDKYREVVRGVATGLTLAQQALADAKAASQAEAAAIVRRRDEDVRTADVERDRAVNASRTHRADEVARLEAETVRRIAELEQKCEADLAAVDAKYPPLLAANEADRDAAEHANNSQYEARRAEAQRLHDAEFAALAERWLGGFRQIADELRGMAARAAELCPDWNETRWDDWNRPTVPPEGIALGRFELPLSVVKHGVPSDPALALPTTWLPLTAAISIAEHPRLVATADGPGRAAAVKVLQLAMLRTLAALPAGLLRFTLIDPAGLGENFGPFMHLADYDEQLAPKQVLTEPKRIEERLTIVTAHMEKVLQKYLRNEFATLAEYNAQAGEVAEPYHVVVAANFPAGFSEIAARRLLAIAEAGPRCGVYVLMSVDRSLRLPYEIKLEPFLHNAMHLDWHEGRFVWQYPLFEKLPLELDELPAPERLNEVLRRAAQDSKTASRVEVAFDRVAPAPETVWTGDTGRELVVPIGRAGAKEMQSLRLGRGTAQHALISGKTGSGKSTLLHALVTNAALHYGPDQVEFYLIDFKKGVEFKTYAAERLPHARVIAIESEREFGVSVLERLDAELRRRGELYRAHAVQDLGGFRAAAPDVPMPRTLLIIDEFQELFVADDKLAQDAGLLLDRLVRQGRAFGVHVILGSQTLAGAYSLARSTLGQMAVRIALECSEADAHLILSDENPAARLLTRPGEAIYNDQNGLTSGNQPFQVAWLPDDQRRQYLHELRDRPVPRAAALEPAIVFEGNMPADVRTNSELAAAVAGRVEALEPTLWLGAAVRIEPPTSLVLRRQSGQHLAILGNDEASALGIMSTAAAAILGQLGDRGAQIVVLNGARPESDHRDAWRTIAAALGALGAGANGAAVDAATTGGSPLTGQAIQVVAPRDAAAVVVALADEAQRRAASSEESPPARFLFIHDVSQIRDLRVVEDDFSFSSAKKAPGADRRFRELLREGPAVGIHVVLWCDSYNALSRAIDRITLRELDFRIALPMSAADSTSFIESPAAGRLGEHRALLYRDDLGTQTKFRPYGAPTPERLAWLAKRSGLAVG